MRHIYTVLRVTAWILTILIPLMILSGFFMSKNFLVPWIDYGLAKYLHGFLLLILVLPFVYLHSLTGILTAVQRHPSLNVKWLKVFFTILWTILFIVMGFFFFAQSPDLTAKSITGQTVSADKTPSTETSATDSPSYTMDEIARHNTPEDCWLLVNGKVYDVTEAIASHPGGTKTIADNCGKESTEAFNTKNKGIPHSTGAEMNLNKLFIGELAK